MLVNEAIAFAEQELKKSNNLNSRLDSEILVSHLINVPRESIYSKLKENLSHNKAEELQKLINRRVNKEPIAYILNNKEFWSTNFYVDRSVLIPRPETEVLIDLILSHINNKKLFLNILDIGTGSGCILISLLKELIKARGIGVDKSKKAIAIAKINSVSQKVNTRALFKNINLEEIKFDKKFDIIVSNPPYLPDVSLENLNLDINAGMSIAITGSSGAGKTTLLRALSGLNKPTSGVVNWMGQTITAEKPEKLVRMGISHVSEGKSVIPELTVKENLELGAIWRKNGKEMKESLDQVVTIFPRLGERISQRSDTLSGGERQMLAIGRAIMSKPKLILLDEPSLGLAPLVVEQIFQTIQDLTIQMGLTVVLVEQNAMGALKIANLGIVLNLGKVVAVDHAQALIQDPAVRAAYLGY